MKTLTVLTSHAQIGDTGKKTGFWLEEFAAPYYVLKDSGATIMLASPKGGQPQLDPKSDLPENQTEMTKRFRSDNAAQAQLVHRKKLAEVFADDFDAVFYPGGHGPMWDMPDNATSIALIDAFVRDDKPAAAVCHAPAALVNVRGKGGEYLVKCKRVTGFTNAARTSCGFERCRPVLVGRPAQAARCRVPQWGELGAPCPSGRPACDRSEPHLFGARSQGVADTASLCFNKELTHETTRSA